MKSTRIGTKAIIIIVVAAIISIIVGYFLLFKDEKIPELLIIQDTEATVYDYNPDPTLENYKNGNVHLTLTILGTVRSIGDPAYGGTIVTVTNPTTGFTASVALPDNTNLWGTTITAVDAIPISAWGSEATDIIKMTVTMSPDSLGQLNTGSVISIALAPYGIDNAYDQTVAENRSTDTPMWNERQTFNVTVSGRDPISLTDEGWHLFGTPWSG